MKSQQICQNIWQNVKKSIIQLAYQSDFRQHCLQIQHNISDDESRVLILDICSKAWFKDLFLNFGIFSDFTFDSGTRICFRANSTSKYFCSAQCSKTEKVRKITKAKINVL